MAASKSRVRVDEEGVEYDHAGRMKYQSSYHPNQYEPWTYADYEYLCRFAEIDGLKDVSLALGRTELVCEQRINILKKARLYEFCKNRRKYWC